MPAECPRLQSRSLLRLVVPVDRAAAAVADSIRTYGFRQSLVLDPEGVVVVSSFGQEGCLYSQPPVASLA